MYEGSDALRMGAGSDGLTTEERFINEVESAVGNVFIHAARLQTNAEMAEFMAYGEPVPTLCGAIWRPTRFGIRADETACPDCEAIYAVGYWELAPSRTQLAAQRVIEAKQAIPRSKPYQVARSIGHALLITVCVVLAVGVVLVRGVGSVSR